MATERKLWLNLGDIDNPKVLKKIINHGDIEDIVSKQRVSDLFYWATLNVIRSLRTFTTRSGHFDLRESNVHDGHVQQVLSFLKEMKKLDDGTLIQHWPRDILREVAKFNPRLCHFYSDSDSNPGPLSYIEYLIAVKELHPIYLYNFDDGKSLLRRYPGLKFNLVLKGSEMVEPYSTLCQQLKLLKYDQLATRELHPSVTTIVLHDEYQYIQDLEFFPNLKSLTITKFNVMYTKPIASFRQRLEEQSSTGHCGYNGYSDQLQLQKVEQSLKCTLNHLDIRIRLLDVEFPVLKAIFDKHPLERFFANSFPKGKSAEVSEERILVEMILQSNLELVDMFTGSFHVVKQNESYKLYITGNCVPLAFRDMDHISRLLTKFPLIQSVHLNESDRKNKDIIRFMCFSIGLTYHRHIEFIEVKDTKKKQKVA